MFQTVVDRRQAWAGISAGLFALLLALPASAQTGIPGLDDVAQTLLDGIPTGREPQTVEAPFPAPRPDLEIVLRSELQPLAVHAAAADYERARNALAALELTADVIDELGWARPLPDGGLGGTLDYDLYLQRGGPHCDEAHADHMVAHEHLDAATSFGVVDPDADLEACVASAYAQSITWGLDPAEGSAWRRATGAYLGWRVTGRFVGDAVTGQQREAYRAPIDGAIDDGSGGALFLLQLSARYDAGTGTFIRELWNITRQRSPSASKLRGSPDLWQAIARGVDLAHDQLSDTIEELAVARWFTGARSSGSPMRALGTLSQDALVPVFFATSWAELPEHSMPVEPELDALGSAYATIDVRGAPPGGLLRVWLRGEMGVTWSLVAARLDANGHELGRVSAPPREAENAYVPVELLAGTERVLIVVTNLSSRLPDADTGDDNQRSCKLIVDTTH